MLSVILTAIQLTFEDRIVKGMSVKPSLLVGMEGVWGCVFLFGICWPFVMFVIPNGEGRYLENLNDSFYMMVDNWKTIFFTAMYFVTAFILNWSGILVI